MADHTDSFLRRAESRIGSTLRDKWRLDSLLGVGGMAAVYAATHRNGKRGAVKLLHPAIAHDVDARARFLREGYVANRIGSQGVVAVLDDDVTDDGSVFLVMELLHGKSVESLLDGSPNGALEPRLAVDITCQLLDVLTAAHAQGVVHRDLKPDNLFLTQQSLVKVLDFGIARLRDATNDNRTQTGSVMGTPAFMPPEQALGDWNRVDHRSDLWAAGATLFSMLTGRNVHDGETVNKVLLAAMTKHAPPLASVLPGVHPALAEIVDMALAFEPERRFQTALDMRLALLSLHDEAPTTIASAQNPQLARTMAAPSAPVPLGGQASALPAQVTLAVPVGDAWEPPRAPRDGTLSAASRSGTFPQPAGQKSYRAAILVTCLVLGGGAGFFLWKNASPSPAPTASAAAAPAPTAEATAPEAPIVAPAATAASAPATSAAETALAASASAAPASALPSTAPAFVPRAPTARPAEPTAPASVRQPGNFDGRY